MAKAEPGVKLKRCSRVSAGCCEQVHSGLTFLTDTRLIRPVTDVSGSGREAVCYGMY